MDDSYIRLHFDRLYQKVFHCSTDEFEQKERDRAESEAKEPKKES